MHGSIGVSPRQGCCSLLSLGPSSQKRVNSTLLLHGCPSPGICESSAYCFCLFLHQSFGEKLTEVMLLVPIVVFCQLLAGWYFLVATDLEFVEMGQMSFRSDVSEEVRDVTKAWTLRADVAIQQT